MQGTRQKGGPLSLTVSHGRVCNRAESSQQHRTGGGTVIFTPKGGQGLRLAGHPAPGHAVAKPGGPGDTLRFPTIRLRLLPIYTTAHLVSALRTPDAKSFPGTTGSAKRMLFPCSFVCQGFCQMTCI